MKILAINSSARKDGNAAMQAYEFVRLCAFFNVGLGCFLDRKAVEELRSPDREAYGATCRRGRR